MIGGVLNDAKRSLIFPCSSGTTPMEIEIDVVTKYVRVSQCQKDLDNNTCFICRKSSFRPGEQRNEVKLWPQDEKKPKKYGRKS